MYLFSTLRFVKVVGHREITLNIVLSYEEHSGNVPGIETAYREPQCQERNMSVLSFPRIASGTTPFLCISPLISVQLVVLLLPSLALLSPSTE